MISKKVVEEMRENWRVPFLCSHSSLQFQLIAKLLRADSSVQAGVQFRQRSLLSVGGCIHLNKIVEVC